MNNQLIIKLFNGGSPILINLDGSTDEFYQRKVRQLIIKPCAAKTYFINLDDVALDLHVSPLCILAYIGSNLSTNHYYMSSNPYIDGTYTMDKLIAIYKSLIENILICSQCDAPSTYLAVKQNDIYQVCDACGAKIRKYYISEFYTWLLEHGNLKQLETQIQFITDDVDNL